MAKNKKKKNKENVKKSRKDLRKAKRNEIKLNKKIYFSKKSKKADQFNINNNKKNVKNEKNTINKNLPKLELNLRETSMDKNKSKPIKKLEIKNLDKSRTVDRYEENRKREINQQKELERKIRKQRMVQLKEANENEDKIIRKLEKKLRIEKHRNEKSVHKMFNDGLDYALELCLPESIEKMYSAAKQVNNIKDASDDEGDFEEDFIVALGKDESTKESPKYENKKKNFTEQNTTKQKKNQMEQFKQVEEKYLEDSDFSEDDSELESHHEDDIDKNSADELSQDEEEELFDNISIVEIENRVDEQSLTKLSAEDFMVGDSKKLNKPIQDDHITFKVDNKADELDNEPDLNLEDIYGRKRDSHGNIIESNTKKYISPHVRARLEAETNGKASNCELKMDRLKKKCKGLLNRLSENNIHKITSEIEQLYMSYSRFDMNNTLSNIILDALVTNVLSKERMVLEYTLFIAILHGNVGSEIGAHFLQVLATKFVDLLNKTDMLDVQHKELDNIVFILSHLYTFNVFQQSLIFEIMKRLSLKLTEKSIECILLILKSVGFKLRKDDPIALKNFILSVQIQANESNIDFKENSRYKFMIDILNAIKNNNMIKIPNYDPTLAEHLKKILKTFFSNGKYLSTLNITIEDLLNADEKGKWWVVGSAWSGNVNDIKSMERNNDETLNKFSNKILELARKQRINTEDRRNAFCVIMSAEDYVDAFERLLNLSLKDHRIISSIIIHCCLSESSFNPYYAALAKRFCEHDRKYQLAIQFSSWDRIKDIDSINNSQIKNLGKFITFLIIQGAQPISILKVIEFTELDKKTLRLVRQIILAILLGDEMECRNVFERIAPSSKLNNFKDSLRLFMNHFLLKGSDENEILKDQISLLKKRINEVDNILAYSNSKLKF